MSQQIGPVARPADFDVEALLRRQIRMACLHRGNHIVDGAAPEGLHCGRPGLVERPECGSPLSSSRVPASSLLAAPKLADGWARAKVAARGTNNAIATQSFLVMLSPPGRSAPRRRRPAVFPTLLRGLLGPCRPARAPSGLSRPVASGCAGRSWRRC